MQRLSHEGLVSKKKQNDPNIEVSNGREQKAFEALLCFGEGSIKSREVQRKVFSLIPIGTG
jgi:hypothetical protein